MAYKGKMGATKENPRTANKNERYRGKSEPALSPEFLDTISSEIRSCQIRR